MSSKFPPKSGFGFSEPLFCVYLNYWILPVAVLNMIVLSDRGVLSSAIKETVLH
jgi:hypothetical protein